MEKQIFNLTFFFLLTLFQSNVCMETSEYQEEPITQEIDGEPLSLNELAPELKLAILKLCLMPIIENNDILDPFKDVLEFIKIAIRINKKHFRPLKNDLILFAYQYAREFFAPHQSKLSQNQLNILLEEKSARFYMEGTEVRKSNIKQRSKIAQLLISGANPNLKTMIFSDEGFNNILFHIARARDKQTWPELIPLLIFYGTSTHAKNSFGKNPAEQASESKNKNMVRILKNYGFEVDQSTSDLVEPQRTSSDDRTDISLIAQAGFDEQNPPKPNLCIIS